MKLTDLDLLVDQTMRYKNFTVLFTDVCGNSELIPKKANLKLEYINEIVECGIMSDQGDQGFQAIVDRLTNCISRKKRKHG